MNLIVLEGRVTAPIERLDEGPRLRARFAISVPGSGRPRRLDVIPITVPDPAPDVFTMTTGTSVFVLGSVHRRFWAGPSGRQSRLDVVAFHVAASTGEAGES